VANGARLSDADLEQALVALASQIDFPDLPDLSPAVGRTLREISTRRRHPLADLRRALRSLLRPALLPAWQRVAVAAVVVVTVLAGTLVASPSVRRAVAGWLGLRGVKIESTPAPTQSLSTSLGGTLGLGERMSLQEAQSRVSYEILLPSTPGLGEPDEVYLFPGTAGDQVFIIYRARAGLPQALSGVGLLLSEFRATIDEEFVQKKLVHLGTVVESITVNGGHGYWIEGEPHVIQLIGPDGHPIEETIRLAGNVLLWEQGELTLRIESALSKEEAIRIAESVG